MSRSRRKKKHRVTKWDAEQSRRVTFSEAGQYYKGVEIDPSSGSSPFAPPGQLPAGPSAVCRGQQPDTSRQYAKLPTREVPVMGPSESGNSVLFTVPEDYARDLLLQGKCTLVPITKHLRALRIIPPPAPQSDKAVSLHQKSIGDPHARDTRDNPRGCWVIEAPFGKEPATFRTFRAIPPNLQKIFRQVVLDCLSKPNVVSKAAA